jgi:Rha family phage regulatory protein
MNPSKAIVTIDQNHAMTTSLVIAEKFEKQHKNVLRDIENIIKKCPDKEFVRLNFEPSKYQVTAGKNSIREENMYNLTRQGFTMVAMGLTGDKAFLWKIAFLNTFDKMEAKLNELLVTEHHSMLADLYAKHPKWNQVRKDTQAGLPQRLIGEFNGMNIRNVQRMQKRIRAAGLDCRPLTQSATLLA